MTYPLYIFYKDEVPKTQLGFPAEKGRVKHVLHFLPLLARRLRKLISSRQPHLLAGRPFYNLLDNIASFRLPRETYLGKKL
jgi:hypothetical protein